MKNRTKILLLISALATASMLSCNSPDLVPEAPMTLEYSIIDGDTVKTIVKDNYNVALQSRQKQAIILTLGDTIITYKEPILNKIPSKKPSLETLKNTKDESLKGKPLKMITLGQSLSAGVREGGYFNEGIKTSFPNLLARQMGIEDFKLPLFDDDEYNGTGRGIITSNNFPGGPITKFLKSRNNLAINEVDRITGRYIGLKDVKEEVNHLAIAGDMARGIWASSSEVAAGNSLTSRMIQGRNKENGKGVLGLIEKMSYDFFVFEMGNEEIIKLILGLAGTQTSFTYKSLDDDLSPYEKLQSLPEIQLVRDGLYPSGAKGVLLNVPDWLQSPYFVNPELIKKALIDGCEDEIAASGYVFDLLFKSSGAIDSLLSPTVPTLLKPYFDTNLNHQLETKDRFSKSYWGNWITETISGFNNLVNSMSKKYGYPVVDMNGLYARVHEGRLVDSFGTKIDKTNFFSADNFYPSPLGNAVIANEIIKTINASYKSDIAYIDTRVFLK